MSAPRLVALLSFMSVLGLAGCGGGGGGGGAGTQTRAGKSVAQAPAKTVTSPPKTGPATTPTASTPTPPPAPKPKKQGKRKGESGAGGGGDEEGNFIPVNIVVTAGGRARPPVVQVPAFFKLTVTLRNAGAKGHAVALSGPGVGGDRGALAPGKSLSFRVDGGKPTTYKVLLDGAPRARIVTGSAPGP